MIDSRIKKMAEIVTGYSANIQPNDYVIIEANTLAEPLVKELYREVLQRGAHCSIHLSFPEANYMFYDYASEEQLQFVSPVKEIEYKRANALLQILSPHNTRSLTRIDPKKRQIRSKAHAPVRNELLKRIGRDLKLCIMAYPTHAMAQEAEMSMTQYEDFFFSACNLNDEDPMQTWLTLDKEQRRLTELLNKKSDFHFISKGTDLKFSSQGRSWINCSGKVNFPDGEIFTGPIEDSVNGHVTFTHPAVFQGFEVEDVYLEFENGKVVKATASKNQHCLENILDTDEGAKYVGEIAIATNYGIQDFTKNILFDEKIGGTMHLALGSSIPESGGKNVSAIHWDMVSSMKEGGKILADGAVIYEGGHFVV